MVDRLEKPPLSSFNTDKACLTETPVEIPPFVSFNFVNPTLLASFFFACSVYPLAY